jgi:hypothetical protein
LLLTKKQRIMRNNSFEILVDNVPYRVEVEPFEFNTETRFKVVYNGGQEHIFTWDSSIGRLAAIDDDSATLPYNLERAIAERIQAGKY